MIEPARINAAGRLNRRRLLHGLALGVGTAAVAGIPNPRALRAATQPTAQAAEQTLRTVYTDFAPGITPAKSGWGGEVVMSPSTYLQPFYIDAQNQLIPGLCTDWTVSDDDLSYRINVDPKAVFSDGSKVTASDIKASWEFMSDPENGFGYASFVVSPVVGYADARDGKTTDISGLRAIDDRTLEISLAQPFSPVVWGWALWLAGVISKRQIESGDPDWQLKPLASGPFMIETWDQAAQTAAWVQNPAWWGAKPTLQRVEMQTIPDPNTLLIVWENDEFDFMWIPDGTMRTQLLAGKYPEQVFDIPNIGVRTLQFDLRVPPMEDVNVRRAFLHATDAATIAPAILGGGTTPATRVNVPGIEGYAEWPSPFDPAAAKAALAASAYGRAEELPPITLAVDKLYGDRFLRLAEALQGEWKEILGVDVTILTSDPASQSQMQRSIFLEFDGSTAPDPSTTVYDMGHSRNYYMQESGIVDPEVDALIDAANALPLERNAERIDLYDQADRLLLDRAYHVPLVNEPFSYAVKPWVKNVVGARDYNIWMPSLLDIVIAER